MGKKNYYTSSGIVGDKYICSLEQLNEYKINCNNTESLEMFYYIANNLKNIDGYEIIYYVQKEDSTRLGVFLFQNKKLQELFMSFDGIDTSLQAYIDINLCHIQYISYKDITETEKDFMTIISGRTNSVYFSENQFILRDPKDHKIVIYGNKNIYCENAKRFYPANLKTLSNMNYYVGYTILDYFSNKYFFWKDILRDFTDHNSFCPIPLSLIWDVKDKKDLFEKKYKISLPKSINKYSMLSAYWLSKAYKYIDVSEFQKICLPEDIISKTISTDTLFVMYYINTLDNYTEKYFHYVSDYCYMAVKMRKKINLKIKSIKGLINEHNRLSIEYKTKYVKKIKVPKNSPFLKLKLPDKYVMIKTKKALVEESVLNENCVSSYDTKINKGQSGIFTTIYNNKRYTIEIKCRKQNKKYIFFVNQLYGKRNSEPPAELKKELKDLIHAENIRLSLLKI